MVYGEIRCYVLPMAGNEKDIRAHLATLSLEEKVLLLSGEDAWSTYALPSIGLRKMLLSDGPSGVRGAKWDERYKSLTLPSATCVAATWDENSLHTLGAVSADEARSKGVDVVLGPTINLHRSPLGGRHFEAYSEDPYLSGKLAAAYIRGLQSCGVAACPKHFVANDSENERMTVDIQVDSQTLHEVYLAPFEIAVREARAWAIMAAYNRVNGVTGTESGLLNDPLRTEWEFDGVAVSDWVAVRSVNASANASLDLAMPGHETPWSTGLLAAVRAGDVPEDAIDEKVLHILTLAQRVGALAGEANQIVGQVDNRSEIRRIAADGFVLVENNGVLPLANAKTKVAVIGSHAFDARIGGGGSATTNPYSPVSPLAGLIANAPEGLEVVGAVGHHAIHEMTNLPLEQIESPTGKPAIQVTWVDQQGADLLTEDRFAGLLIGMSEPVADATKKILGTAKFTAKEQGSHRFGLSGIGTNRLKIDGALVLDAHTPIGEMDALEALIAAPEKYVDVDLLPGQTILLEYEYIRDVPIGFDGIGVLFGYRAPRPSAEMLIQQAVDLAADSDIAIVVVGTTAHVESEGYDRSSMRLPGRQDELVNEIAKANRNTIVVVNAGSPVEMPWRNDVAALLLTWFPGEEYGNALADVVYGSREPGGRLPTTWGANLADVPVSNTQPIDGALKYSEGLDIGYRAWAKVATKPAYPFGFGLGYSTFEYDQISATKLTGGSVLVEVNIRNTGPRDGSDVVQVYLRRLDSSVKRPHYWLAGFAKARLKSGQSQRLEIVLDVRRFEHYADGWALEPGAFEIFVSNSSDLAKAHSMTVEI